MISLEADCADELWRLAAQTLATSGTLQKSRIGVTREVLHVASTIRRPRDRIVFSRALNPAFMVAELIWILSGREDLAFLECWNKQFREYSDDGHLLAGAYGNRLRSRFGFDQLRHATQALKHARESRQVVLQIWDARSDFPSPAPVSKDIPCNVVAHIMIRDDRLEWLQVMRSNDIVWGLPYNLAQFTTLQETVAGWLEVEVGSYNHISDSLHVYEDKLSELALAPESDARPANHSDLRLPLKEWERSWPHVVATAEEIGRATEAAQVQALLSSFSAPQAYHEWISVLAAERFRRIGETGRAHDAIEQAGPCWKLSWQKWDRRLVNPRQSP